MQPTNNKKAHRTHLGVRYDLLEPAFLRAMAQLMSHGQHYDMVTGVREQWKRGLEDDKCPLNHIMDHLCAYELSEPHDHLGSRKGHLAAIAVNAMFEYFFEERREAELLVQEQKLDEALTNITEPQTQTEITKNEKPLNILDMMKTWAGRVTGGQ